MASGSSVAWRKHDRGDAADGVKPTAGEEKAAQAGGGGSSSSSKRPRASTAEGESAASLLSRTARPHTTRVGVVDDLIEGYGGPQRGKVCEIFGPTYVGKTAVLMDVAVRALLPKHLGGHAMSVTWVDCDGRFSLPRFKQIAWHRALAHTRRTSSGGDGNGAGGCTERALEGCMSQQLRVYQLPSSRHLEVLLRRMATDQAPHGVSYRGGLRKQMLILDQINAFYWIDMLEGEEPRTFKAICTHLSKLDMSIFASKSPLYTQRERASHREYMGDSWSRLVKFRIALFSHHSLERRLPTPGVERERFEAVLLLPAGNQKDRRTATYAISDAGVDVV